MTLTSPFWLILIIPICVAFWLLRFPSRFLLALRIVTVALLLLAICGLSITLPGQRGSVVVVADRSLSMPAGSQSQQLEAVNLLTQSMGKDDELGVVSFAEKTAVDQPPQRTQFGGFTSDVGADASNLGDGIDRALSLIPAHRRGRILVLSDGLATGPDLNTVTARAASSGVAIDYRTLQRSGVADLAIERIDAPSSVAANEAFLISAWIDSPRAQQVAYELAWGAQILSTGQLDVPEGRSRILFRDKAGDAGTRSYSLKIRSVSSETSDPVPENNSARFLIGVRGAKPLLCVSPKGSSLPALLKASGLKVEQRRAEECSWSLSELTGYTAVILEDTPAGEIGTAGMETLAAWVTDAGGGLLTTGGRNAYGIGGYFKSPLEPVLPVSMELRREHRKLSLAIVVVLDRSGSMAAAVSGGRTKMDLANVATSEVLNQLSGADQFGCIAVDSSPHTIVPLSDVSNKAAMQNDVLRIDSMGGGIFVYEALRSAAEMISDATAGTRHIILFSDAADSEEPGNYKELLEKCRKAGITVSVIGLGTEHDSDAQLLIDIGRRGGGQCQFTQDAHELPRLFAQDALLVSRSTFVEEKTAIRTTAGMTMLTPERWNAFPDVGGYNLCYLRPGANLAAMTQDEYQAPLVASWQAGTGRVLSFTGEADGKFTGALGKWTHSGDFFSSLARWVSSQEQGLGPDMLLTQELQGGRSRIKLHLDSERATTPFNSLPQLTILRGIDGQKPVAEQVKLNWSSADSLTADVSLAGGETVLTSLDLPGVGRATLPPICLPYSPEFATRGVEEGRQTLERMAGATTGTERVNLTEIWKEIPRTPRFVSLAPWLLFAAMGLLLLDVLHRRTGLLTLATSRRGLSRTPRKADREITKTRPRGTNKTSRSSAASQSISPSASPSAPEKEQSSVPPPVPQEDVMDALTQARNRAARRTQR